MRNFWRNFMKSQCNIRATTKEDIDTIYFFIQEIARYEKLENQVIATKEKLLESIFIKKQAEVFLLEIEQKAIGFIIIYEHFSSFIGQSGIYLEDIFILKEYRNFGYGKQALVFIAQLGVQRNVHRIEWSVLNWNEPSIAFYKSINAIAMDEWTTFRLEKDEIVNLANQTM